MKRGFWCALIPLVLAPAAHAQQSPDTATSTLVPRTTSLLEGTWIDRLPSDRIENVLTYLPGTSITRFGELTLRGAGPEDVNVQLDGFSIRPAFLGLVASVPVLSYHGLPGTNAVTSALVVTGPLQARFGNTGSGLILLETRYGGSRFAGAGAFESDALFGSRHGPGINRFQGSAGGSVGQKIRLFGSLVLQGQQSADVGSGADLVPIFDLAGLDTTVAVPSAVGDPLADTTFVDVSRFAVARGRCDAFAASVNTDIADNYGVGCEGIRTPVTNAAAYMLSGRADYALSERGTLSLTGLASQDQQRFFSYRDLTNPVGLTAARGWSRIVNLAWSQALNAPAPMTLRLGISLQRDRALSGPLTPGSEADSRSSFVHLLLSPLDFSFDFDNFPIDETLVTNYRDNIPGSRRTPYDLENVDQYTPIDRYRNSPYGVGSFVDSGGPVSRITLLRENRTVGMAQLGWAWSAQSRLEAGFDLTRYSVSSYSAQLNTLILSDVWIEKPSSTALYLQNTLRFGDGIVVAGVRYDRFSTGAARPFVLDTISSSPHYNTYSYFPTPNSYGSGGVTFQGQPLVKFVEDESHGAVAPRVQVAYQLRPGTVVRAGFARENRMPDLALLLTGINTDLRITSTNQFFGGDFGFERTDLFELGLRRQLRPGLDIDVSGYQRTIEHQAVGVLAPLRDPARAGNQVDILMIDDRGASRVKGVELRIEGRAGPVQGIVGYSYQDAEQEILGNPLNPASDVIPAANSRPHGFAGLLMFDVPEGWGQGSLPGRILSRVGAAAGFRYTSGTPYTRCAASTGNDSNLIEDLCTFPNGELNGARLPAFKQFDLRVTKGFTLRGAELTMYLDARNVFNFSNVIDVFTTTGQTSNPVDRARSFAQDSFSLANEAQFNGTWQGNGDIDLTFSGAVASGCGNYVNTQNQPSAPSCVYLIRAEERFGDGDHIYTVAEQRLASRAYYDANLGNYLFHTPPRRLRLGLELRF